MKGKTTDNRVWDVLHIACHVWGDHSLEIHLLSVNPVQLYWLFFPSWYISAQEKSCSESPREKNLLPTDKCTSYFLFYYHRQKSKCVVLTFTIITRPDTQLRHKYHMGFATDTFSSPDSSAISTHLSSLSPLNTGTIMISPLKIWLQS